MSDGTITVASTVDADFLPHVGPVVTSIAQFASPHRPIEYRVFYSGAENADTRALDGFTLGPVTVRIISAPTDFERFSGRSKMGVATLVRLYAGELMPDLDRTIFLDVDLVVRANIAQLFDIDLAGLPFAAVRDFTIYPWLAQQSVEPPGDSTYALQPFLSKTIGLTERNWLSYVNTGVSVMDLAAMRREGFGSRAASLLEGRVDELLWPDQDAFNIVFRDRIALLDPRWNVQVNILQDRIPADVDTTIVEGIRRQRRDRAIVHFAGPRKPWSRMSYLPHSGEWWHFASRSPTYPSIRASHDKVRRAKRTVPNPAVGAARVLAAMRYSLGPRP